MRLNLRTNLLSVSKPLLVLLTLLLSVQIPSYAGKRFFRQKQESSSGQSSTSSQPAGSSFFNPSGFFGLGEENPVLRGFGGGGGEFEDPSSKENDNYHNDNAPVPDGTFLLGGFVVLYGAFVYGRSVRKRANNTTR